MTTVIILKKMAGEELVLVPRREYERLLKMKAIKEFKPTPTQKKSLLKAEKNLKSGKTLSLNTLARKLGLTS